MITAVIEWSYWRSRTYIRTSYICFSNMLHKSVQVFRLMINHFNRIFQLVTCPFLCLQLEISRCLFLFFLPLLPFQFQLIFMERLLVICPVSLGLIRSSVSAFGCWWLLAAVSRQITGYILSKLRPISEYSVIASDSFLRVFYHLCATSIAVTDDHVLRGCFVTVVAY